MVNLLPGEVTTVTNQIKQKNLNTKEKKMNQN